MICIEFKCIKADIRIHPTSLTVLVHPPVAALDIVRDFRLVSVTQVHVAALADFACEIADQLCIVLRDAVLDTIIARPCGICNPFCTVHCLGDSCICISAALVVHLVPHCGSAVDLACSDAQLLANPCKRATNRLGNPRVMLRDLPRRLHVREKHTHRVIGNNFVGCRLLVKAKIPHILGDRVKPRLASLFASLL